MVYQLLVVLRGVSPLIWRRLLVLLKIVTEFGGYIRANATWIPNYGERHRSGEAISSAFVESTVAPESAA